MASSALGQPARSGTAVARNSIDLHELRPPWPARLRTVAIPRNLDA
jgi:hypothetical protein